MRVQLEGTICGVPLGDGSETTLAPGVYLLPPKVAEQVLEVRAADGRRVAHRTDE